MTSPQKGKQLRVPKPTAKYDNKLTATLKYTDTVKPAYAITYPKYQNHFIQ